MKKLVQVAMRIAETHKARNPLHDHCRAVADILESIESGSDEVAAALLYGVVKCGVPIEDITEALPFENNIVPTIVGALASVPGLTELPNPSGPSVLKKKSEQALALAKQHHTSVMMVALAIEVANLQAIAKARPPWSEQRRLDYACGAKLVAGRCGGVNTPLDKLFAAAHDRLIRKQS
jgi:(p)ppGpp synthase/HD superfamily hydrolase